MNRSINFIASTTFGIYLIHSLLNHKLYTLEIMIELFSFNAILGTIVLELLIFNISMAIMIVLKKIPVIRWFL